MVLLSACFLWSAAAVVAVIFTAVYLYFKYSYNHWKRLGVPHFEPKFPYGNCMEVVKATKPFGEALQNLYTEMKSRGNSLHMGLYFFHMPMYVPLSPDLVKNVLSREFAHFYDRGTYYNEESDPLSAHLFSLTGRKWKNLRAKLTPTFTSGKLKYMFQILVDCSHELRECLNTLQGEPVDIKKILSQFTTNVIGSCAFGIECNCFKNPDTGFIKMGSRIFQPLFFDRIKIFFSFVFPSVARLFGMRVTNRAVDDFFRGLVKETVEYREKNGVTRNDFMQLLLQLKNKGKLDDDEATEEAKSEFEEGTTLTLNEVSAQAFLFFGAGFETSSTAMTFCLFELSQNQHIQEKLREEIVHVLKKYDGKITYDAILEMHYLDRVVQESLRKYPPLMLLQRIVTKDYKVPNTDVTLKRESIVLIPVLALQNDPEYYPNPEIFDPDRFTEENKASRPDFTYLPFGDGPRNCIGLRFGLMQIKVGLCQLLLNYKFTLNPKTTMPLVLDPSSFFLSATDKIWLDAAKVTS